jgi:hypothetical protein
MPPLTLKPSPLAAAVEKFGARTAVGSVLRSAEWEDVALGLRERAFWSAGVEHAGLLQGMKDRLAQALQQARDPETGAFMGKERFIVEARRIASEAGLGTGGKGDWRNLKDVTSVARLGLIYDMNTRQATGYARRKADLTAGALDAAPAYEFIRLTPKRVPREDWPDRFREACDESGDEAALSVLDSTGRMMALKTSEVWENLSRFGTPWAPFDYGSGMGLRSVPRAEAEGVGLIAPDEAVEPGDTEQRFNDKLEASVADLDTETRDALRIAFGPQIAIEGDRVRWQADVSSYTEIGSETDDGFAIREMIRSVFKRKRKKAA